MAGEGDFGALGPLIMARRTGEAGEIGKQHCLEMNSREGDPDLAGGLDDTGADLDQP